MRTLLMTCALVLTSPAWSLGQVKPKAKQAAPAPQPAKVRSDAAIEGDIRARFLKSKIRVEGFTVKVQGGVAMIEGKTKVIQRKGVATRLAKLGGARGVDNRIQIDEAARQRAAANLERGRRRAQVKRGQARTETTAGPPKR